MATPPPLPPGFVLAPQAPVAAAPAGRPTLTPLGPPVVRQPPPQTPATAQHDENVVTLDQLRIEREQRERDAGPGAAAAESERKAAAFLIRALGANQQYETTHVQPRSVPGQALANAFPNIAYAAADPQRQTAEDAQNEFIAASLRQDSGAAIPPEEIVNQRNIYFPRPGASPEAIAAARERRARAIEGLLNSGGRSVTPEMRRAAEGYLEALGRYNAASLPSPGHSTAAPPNPPEGGDDPDNPRDPEDPDRLVVNVTGQGTPAFEAAFAQAHSQNPRLTRTVFDEQRRAARAAAVAARAAEGPPTTLERMTMLLPPVAAVAGLAAQFDGSPTAVMRGALDTETLGFSDEAQASLSAATGSGTFDGNLATRRGIANYDSENNPLSRTAGQVIGGFALPMGEVSSVGRLAATGAGYAGAYGLGSGDGITDRLIRAGEGAAAGAIAAPILSVAGQAASATFRGLRGLVSGRSGPVADAGGVAAQDLIAAADRQDVDVMPADVGGPMTRRLTSGMAQLPFASGPIINAAERTTNQVGARVGEIAAAEGAPVRQEALGEAARDAAQGYIDRSGAEGRRLYDAARAAAGDSAIAGHGGIAALDAHVAELSQTASTSAPEIAALNQLRNDLVTGNRPKDLSIDAIRRLRTNVRAMAMSEELRGTDFQRRAGEVLNALSEDVAQSLTPEAAAAFRTADQHWADRLNVIDDVMANVLGPRDSRSAEQVAQRLISMSRGDSGRLKTFLDHATPEEAGVIRSSLIQELGSAPAGQHGASGPNFSLSSFLTNWNRLPERSRNILFRGDSRSAIEDLATIASGSREAGKYANRSNTGGAVNSGDIIRGLSIYSAWGSAGASAIIENLTGRLLASPRFARWLARPAADPGTRVRRLAQIAAREPQLAQDLLPIQQALETTTRRAAAQQEDDRR